MKRVPMTLVTAAGLHGQAAGAGGIVRADPALDKLIARGAKTEKVLGNLRFTEGPDAERDPEVDAGRRALGSTRFM